MQDSEEKKVRDEKGHRNSRREGVQKVEGLKRLMEGETSLSYFHPLNDEMPPKYADYNFEAEEGDEEYDDGKARMVQSEYFERGCQVWNRQ